MWIFSKYIFKMFSIIIIDEVEANLHPSMISQFMEMIAILATGGSLSTIGGATGLGSNLADV